MSNKDGFVAKMSRAGEQCSINTNTELQQRAESSSAALWEPGGSQEPAPCAPLG